jgi:hypothetical protein
LEACGSALGGRTMNRFGVRRHCEDMIFFSIGGANLNGYGAVWRKRTLTYYLAIASPKKKRNWNAVQNQPVTRLEAFMRAEPGGAVR